MNIYIIGISFIVIWFGTVFFIARYVKKLRNDLLKKFSDTEKSTETKSENIKEENEERSDRPFDFVGRADPNRLLLFIQQEHPQVIALVLSYLEPYKSSIILKNLPDEVQSEVSRRIACMDRVSPEILREIERVLEKKLATMSSEDYFASGGVESIAEIFNLLDRSSEKKIFENLEDEDPELAEEIKKRMFVFEDIVMLGDQDIQRTIREVDSREIVKALKSVDSEVQDKIFRNMSKLAASMLKKDMERIGPIRLKDVEESQQKIVSIIRNLGEKGEIVIARAGEDELVV
jgi:flagellar motor switch protein FliG